MAFVFSDCILDDTTREFLRGGQAEDIQPKVFDLLLLLAKGGGQIVEREKLERSLWGEVRVGEDSLRRLVKEARRAVGDDGAKQRVILTSRGVGYRLGVAVERLDRMVSADRPVAGFQQLVENLHGRLVTWLEQGPGLLVVVGGPGSGKSRAMQELQARMTSKGARSITVRPDAFASPAPFSTLASLSRQLQPLLQADTTSNVAGGILRGQDQATPVSERPAADPEGIDVALELVADLREVARVEPLVIVIEGLESIDLGSLATLDLLLDELRGSAIVILGTCRDAELAQRSDANRLMERLIARPEAERWKVPPLTVQETTQLVLSISGTGGVVGEEIHRLTSGNPLLVEELSREIASQGLPPGSDGDDPLRHVTHEIVNRRMALVDGNAREVLKIASLMGESIDTGLLAQVTERPPEQVDRFLDQAVKAGLLERPTEAPERPRFIGELFRQALNERVAKEGRLAESHERIGLALVGAHGDGPAAELARHFLAAPEPVRSTRGVPYAELAAARARDVGAWSEAAVHSRAAAQVLRENKEWTPAAELLIDTAEAELRSGGIETARASFRLAMDCARDRDANAFARAALGFADRPSQIGDADPVVEQVLLAAQGQHPADRGLQLMVASRLAAEQRYDPSAGALDEVRRVAGEARRFGDPSVLGRVLDDQSFTEFAPEDPGGWLALNAEIVKAGLQAGSSDVQMTGLKGRVTEFLEMGDLASVERELLELEALGDRLRSPYARWLVASVRATVAFLRGDFEEARRAAAIASQEGARTQSPDVIVQAGAQAFYQALEADQLVSLEPAVLDFRKRFPGTAAWKAAHALLMVESGRHEDAAEFVSELCRDQFSAVQRDRGWLLAIAASADVAVLVGREDLASHCTNALSPFEDLCVVVGSATLFYGSNAYWLGRLALLQGDLGEAARLLDKGLSTHERMGALPWCVASRLACCQLSLMEGRTSDARADHEEASSLANRLGLVRRKRQLEEIIFP